MRNMHRVDSDSSGAVSFLEFVQIFIFRETFYSKNIVDKSAYKKCIERKKFQMAKIER